MARRSPDQSKRERQSVLIPLAFVDQAPPRKRSSAVVENGAATPQKRTLKAQRKKSSRPTSTAKPAPEVEREKAPKTKKAQRVAKKVDAAAPAATPRTTKPRERAKSAGAKPKSPRAGATTKSPAKQTPTTSKATVNNTPKAVRKVGRSEEAPVHVVKQSSKRVKASTKKLRNLTPAERALVERPPSKPKKAPARSAPIAPEPGVIEQPKKKRVVEAAAKAPRKPRAAKKPVTIAPRTEPIEMPLPTRGERQRKTPAEERKAMQKVIRDVQRRIAIAQRGVERPKASAVSTTATSEAMSNEIVRFATGERLKIVRYIPPLPKGATVTVLGVRVDGDEAIYHVEGRRPIVDDAVELWVAEADLKAPLML